ncbi:kinase-like domain-containing protein [Chytriomyces sp. MP71]|nr:kinase-like domain-containing protein [Chytriomyces sp. MP71]
MDSNHSSLASSKHYAKGRTFSSPLLEQKFANLDLQTRKGLHISGADAIEAFPNQAQGKGAQRATVAAAAELNKPSDTTRSSTHAPPLPPRPSFLKASVTKYFGGHQIASSVASASSISEKADTLSPAEDVFDSFKLAQKVRMEEQVPVSEATKRNCKMTSVYFLDYYFDLVTYLDGRRKRTQDFQEIIQAKQVNEAQVVVDWKAFCAKERSILRGRRTRLRLSSFQILLQIGQGGYGQVFLVRKRDATVSGSHEFMALKKMSKRALKKMGEVQHVLTERDILTRANSEWLVKLYYAFQDMESVYLAMEYVPGGDVRTLLNNSGVLREEHACFYMAEMATAVSELHRLGFIHRDLKPENYLIDARGHLKLTDFGLSRGSLSEELVQGLRARLEKVREAPYVYRSMKDRRNLYKSVRRNEDMRAFSQVGSPDYMAPEVLTKNGAGYGLGVDYWSLGCILFECLCGFPPFTGQTTDDIWVNVYHWQKVLERPIYSGEDEEFNLTDVAWDLVTRLIALPQDRITSLSVLQNHPFFENYPFTFLRSPSMVPPFVPSLASATDTSYFDDFSNPNDMAMYKEVKERQAKLEKKLEEGNEDEKRKGKGGTSIGQLFQRLGSSGSSAIPKDDDGLRAAFIGFTFKHKDVQEFEKSW